MSEGDGFNSKRQLALGTAWMVAVRWSIRLTGFISTVILARLLTPADYGLVAIATLIVGMVEIFSQTGQYAAIIRHPSPTREHYDSAWTVALFLGFALGGTIWALIPLTTAYFHEPRAAPVVAVLALRTMLIGAVNIGVVNFQRDLNFRRQFAYSVWPALVSFVATVGAAFELRNYWALVIGILAKQASTLVLSYLMEPFRPRIGFSKVREIWGYSIWTLLRGIGQYVSDQVDKVAIGGFAGAAGMGRYSVGRDLSTMVGSEVAAPMYAVLLPVMAKVQHDKKSRRELYLGVLYWSALIVTSICTGVALVAEDMVDLVLGPRWHDVYVLVPWFSLWWGVSALSWSAYSAFETIGQPMISARLQWVRVSVSAATMVSTLYFFRSITAAAAANLAAAIIMTPTLFWALSRALDVPVRDFGVTIFRPLLSGLSMAIVVLTINAGIWFAGPLRLLVDIVSGATTYGACLLFLWTMAGRPAGPEADALRFVRSLMRSTRHRIA